MSTYVAPYVCKVQDCETRGYQRGWCVKHYRRWQRNGDPVRKMQRDHGDGGVNNQGYLMVQKSGKTVGMHRHIMEKHLGRKLLANEVVHHINEDKLDNRIENLQVMDRSEHIIQHKLGKFRVEGNSKTHRRCNKCSQVLAHADFFKVSRNTLGLSYHCRKCNVAINKRRKSS